MPDTFGHFLLAIKAATLGYEKAAAELARMGATKAALAEGGGPGGGYLIPPQWDGQIVNIAAPLAIVRPRATIIPMTSRTIDLPYLDQSATPAAASSALIGNVALAWGTEGASVETEPTFRSVQLSANKLTGYAIGATELTEDSAASMGEVLAQLFGRAVAWSEDAAGIAGTGVNQPLGVINAPCTIAINRNTSGHFKLVDAYAMLAKAHPNSINAGTLVWAVHPTVVPDIGAFTGLQPQAPLQIAGYPVKISEQCSVLGTPGDVLLADFGHYLIGERTRTAVAYSGHARFGTFQDVWRLTHRIDGQPWLSAPITLKDGATTVSPFVKLS